MVGRTAGRAREQGWLRTLTAAAEPALHLVCFPHSGGTVHAFAEWASAMPADVQLLAVQYPGRGDRFVEPLVDDVPAMATYAAADLQRLPGDLVLFGHSLGGVVAYETAVALRDRGREPVRLCASACLPPGQNERSDVYPASDEEFWDTLCALGGIEPGIAKNLELRDILVPSLRSDLRAHATYRPRPATEPLSCPISCYHGLGDPLVDEQHLQGWAAFTTGGFNVRSREGGHFHLNADPAGLIAGVLERDPV